jgi:hypothetical protein
MSFVISGSKRFLVVLFYCAKRSIRSQPGRIARRANRDRLPNLTRSPMSWVPLRQFRLCKRIGNRMIGMTLIIADSKQLDLLGELKCLQ